MLAPSDTNICSHGAGPAGNTSGAQGPDRVAVPQRRPLRGALLGVVVDADKAYALVVAVRPLEVVHQRPREVAADVGALLAGQRDGADVRVEVGDAVLGADEAGLVGLVVEGGAVLGDEDRQAVVVVQ